MSNHLLDAFNQKPKDQARDEGDCYIENGQLYCIDENGQPALIGSAVTNPNLTGINNLVMFRMSDDVDVNIQIDGIVLESERKKIVEAEVEKAKLEAAVVALNWAVDLCRKIASEVDTLDSKRRSHKTDTFLEAVSFVESKIKEQQAKAMEQMQAGQQTEEERALKEALLELGKALGKED